MILAPHWQPFFVTSIKKPGREANAGNKPMPAYSYLHLVLGWTTKFSWGLGWTNQLYFSCEKMLGIEKQTFPRKFGKTHRSRNSGFVQGNQPFPQKKMVWPEKTKLSTEKAGFGSKLNFFLGKTKNLLGGPSLQKKNWLGKWFLIARAQSCH